MVSNTETSFHMPVYCQHQAFVEPTSPEARFDFPAATGSNTGIPILRWSGAGYIRYEHRPFSSGDGISCFSFPASCKLVSPAGHQPRSIPPDEPGIGTAEDCSCAGMIGGAGENPERPLPLRLQTHHLGGNLRSDPRFCAFCRPLAALSIPSIVVMC